jgi:hypothetical protein
MFYAYYIIDVSIAIHTRFLDVEKIKAIEYYIHIYYTYIKMKNSLVYDRK